MSNNDNKGTSFEELQAWLDNGQATDTFLAPSLSEKIQSANQYYAGVNAGQGVLGSREDITGVILATGQLHYKEPLAALYSAFPLNLNLHYVAREDCQTGLGRHWTFGELSRFEEQSLSGEISYRLFYPDGRKFDFNYNKKANQLIDQGNLGVKVSWDDNKVFTLRDRFGYK